MYQLTDQPLTAAPEDAMSPSVFGNWDSGSVIKLDQAVRMTHSLVDDGSIVKAACVILCQSPNMRQIVRSRNYKNSCLLTHLPM